MSEASTSATPSPAEKSCPKCGAAIPPEAPQGLCPKCLLQQASFPTETGATTHHTRPAPPDRDELARAFPHLEILELIGQGGMGFVYKARQPKLDRLVALKILAQPLAEQTHFAERFTREGRTLAKLSHPNIVTIHDFGQAGPFFYLLMEYVDGVNLRQAMRAGAINSTQALAIVPRICEALQYAHNEGVLHRDIKPDNILLDTRGRVKIADFGIAKLMAEAVAENPLTGSGASLGTPHYMAPEQIEKPNAVDHRADIYSLGVVFYEMLTGELPLGRFAAPSATSGIDPRLDDVVFQTLEKQPDRRPQSADEVKTKVETIASDPNTRPTSTAAQQPVTFKMSRCYISTPEFLQTWIGRQFRYTGAGELRLDEENVTFSPRRRNWIVIPLRAITGLSLLELPAWVSKRTRGLKLISVTFTEKSQPHRFFFIPNQGAFSPIWETNRHVEEWFGAIQNATRARTGRIPPNSAADIEPLPTSNNRHPEPFFATAAKAAFLMLILFGVVLIAMFGIYGLLRARHQQANAPSTPEAITPQATNPQPTAHSRVLELTTVYNTNNTAMCAHISTDPLPGEKFLPVIRYADGPWGSSGSIYSKRTWTSSSRGTNSDLSVTWILPTDSATPFEMAAAALRGRVRAEQGPLTLTTDQVASIFEVTNAAKQVVAGGIRYIKSNQPKSDHATIVLRNLGASWIKDGWRSPGFGFEGGASADIPSGYRLVAFCREGDEQLEASATASVDYISFFWSKPTPKKFQGIGFSESRFFSENVVLKIGEPLEIFSFRTDVNYRAGLILVRGESEASSATTSAP